MENSVLQSFLRPQFESFCFRLLRSLPLHRLKSGIAKRPPVPLHNLSALFLPLHRPRIKSHSASHRRSKTEKGSVRRSVALQIPSKIVILPSYLTTEARKGFQMQIDRAVADDTAARIAEGRLPQPPQKRARQHDGGTHPNHFLCRKPALQRTGSVHADLVTFFVTVAPIFCKMRHMQSTSEISGQFRSVVFPAIRMVDARIGSTAFFDPCTVISP